MAKNGCVFVCSACVCVHVGIYVYVCIYACLHVRTCVHICVCEAAQVVGITSLRNCLSYSNSTIKTQQITITNQAQ